jgi:branched-subunit amino acid transport protein
MIETSYFWWNIFFLAVGTFAIRASIIAVSSKVKISDWYKEIFSYIPAAILPAFIAPAVFFHEGHIEYLYGKERFLVLVLATVVCFVWRSTLATIGFGLALLFTLNLFT